jgi:hypothetical protein
MRPLGDALSRLGRDVVVADLRAARAEPPHLLGWVRAADDVLARFDAPPVVVGHSGAGPLLPLVRGAGSLVFIDAGLPGVVVDSSGVYEQAIERADASGSVPPWARWWPAALVSALVDGDESLVAELVADGPPLTVSQLQETAPEPEPGWECRPAAYLAFGDQYEVFARQAEGWGWPVRRFEGRHLHHMVAADAVAAAVVELSAG